MCFLIINYYLKYLLILLPFLFGFACEISAGSDDFQDVGEWTDLCGRKKPNNWGLYDMTGTVEEWCWDGGFWQDVDANHWGIQHGSRRYLTEPCIDPSVDNLGSNRVLRGLDTVSSRDVGYAASFLYGFRIFRNKAMDT